MSILKIDRDRLTRMAELRNYAFLRMLDAYGYSRFAGYKLDYADYVGTSAARRDFLIACSDFHAEYKEWLELAIRSSSDRALSYAVIRSRE